MSNEYDEDGNFKRWRELVDKGAENWTLDDIEAIHSGCSDSSFAPQLMYECISRLRDAGLNGTRERNSDGC